MADTIPTAWRKLPPASRTGPRRRRILGVLIALVAVSGAAVGALLWLSPTRTPTFVPVWIAVEPGAAGVAGVVPWSEQDRQALTEGHWFGVTDAAAGPNPSRDQIRLRLKALAKRKARQPLVVYLAAPAGLDSTGQAYLLAADPLGDHPRNRLAVAEALELIRDCPATHKLVVLDLWPLGRPSLTNPPPGVMSAAVVRALDEVPDARRLTLTSCDAGQAPHASATLGRTVFGHYLEAGLRGAADGWNLSADRDGRVSVAELAAYTRARVNRWSEAAASAIQTPRLFGTAADFDLHPSSADDVLTFFASPPTLLGAYPDWLKTAWEERDRLLTTSAPSRLRLWTEALLAAERAWTGGRPPGDVQRELERAVREPAVQTEAAGPTPSLAALALTMPADPKLAEELKAAILKAEVRPTAPGAPAAAATSASRLEAWPELEPFKARPHAALAAAAFALLADDPAPPAPRLRQLDRLLAAQEPTPRYSETLLLRQLANLLADPENASVEGSRVALALRTGRDFEQAAVVPEVLRWAAPALDEAYRAWRAAEAALFSPGYVSSAVVGQRLGDAAAAVGHVKAYSDAVRNAAAARDTALRYLGSAYPAYAAGIVARPAADRLADATRGLIDAMQPPPQPLALAGLAGRADEWRRRASEVRIATVEFARPFTGPALAALRERTAGSDAGPATAREVLAVLQTGIPTATERAALWDAAQALGKRVSDGVTRKDASEDEAVVKGTTAPAGYRDPTLPAGPLPRATDALERQEQWSAIVLRATGLADDRLSPPAEPGKNEAVRLERLRGLWYDVVPARPSAGAADPALAWVVPEPLAMPRAATSVLRSDRTLWASHARRYEYEAHDPLGPDSGAAGVAFATAAARACRLAAGEAAVEPYLDVVPPTHAAFEPDTKAAIFNIGFRLVGATSPLKVALDTQSPFPDWVAARVSAEIELTPGREEQAPMRVAVSEGRVPAGTARGILLEASVAGRTFHCRVPIALDAVANRLDLLVRANPKLAPHPIGDFRLRPHGLALPYYFLLSNPGARPRTVVVRQTNLNVATAPVTVPPRSFLPLAFPAPPPVVPAAPAPLGTPPVVASVLRELDEALEFEVLEGEPRKVVQRFEVNVELADPSRYLTVTDVVYRPAVGGQPNNLSARLVPETPLADPPCPVELAFPADRNPGLTVRDGKLKGTVPTDGQPLRLYAENIAAGGAPPTQLVVTLSADGSERAFTYAGQVPAEGEVVRLASVTAPLVRLKTAPFATGIAPLPLRVEVDNPPAGGRIELRLGSYKDERFVSDAERTIGSPRARIVSAGIEKDGAVLLRAVLRDWETTLPVEFLVGARELEAKLKDASGRVMAEDRVMVTFDNAPPGNIQFLGLPPRAAKDKPLVVRATCEPTISGLKEVKFFFGKPINNAAPPNAAMVAGKLVDPKANVWEAALPPGGNGPTTVTVLFTSKAGLTGAASQDVELVDPANLVKPEPATIAGKVVEGTLAIGGLEVVLFDAKGEKARAKTKPDGTFEFADLPPGKYRLHVEREATGRKADKTFDLKNGEAKTMTLELFL